jgi:hypothetical protein
MTVSDRELMLLHDGELDPERARVIRALRFRDPTVHARLAGLAQLSAFTRAWAKQNGVTRAERALPARARSRGLHRGLGIAALALSAAAVALMPSTPTVPRESAAKTGVLSDRATAVPPTAVAVENVDFGSHAGTIFSVRGAGSDTTVVWLSDDVDSPSSAL